MSRPAVQVAPNDSLMAMQARAKFQRIAGYDVAHVLDDDHWSVAIINCGPEVLLSLAGVRAVATLSPHMRGAELAEDLIRLANAGETA